MEALQPPADVNDLHEQLVAQARRLADQLGELRAAVDNGDVAQLEELGREIESSSFKQLADAARAIQAKGFDIGDWQN
jgi:hypothetical protein